MIPYILYTSLILSTCLIFYKLLLQKETFFHLNRFVLLSGMMLAFILPLIHVPQEFSFRNAPVSINSPGTETPVLKNATAGATAQKADAIVIAPAPEKQMINLQQVLQYALYLYWFGVVIFSLVFIMQAVILIYKAYSRPVIIDGRFRIVEISGDKAPCSFGNNIFINPEKYDWETYNQVLLHEKIHIEHKHTLDLLFAEMVLIFQWFNPFAWWWRNELESNLEFFTDNKLLQHDTVQKESYQMSLLKVAAPHFPLSLTTNYNQSLLKKRLLMMNAKKSNVHTIWKYFFILPVMVLFVCLFNEPIVKAQNTSSRVKPKAHPHTDNELKTEGNWFATIKGDKINIQFRNDDDNNSSNGNSFSLSEFKDLPRDKAGSFSLSREAGTMDFKGKFDGDKGMGDYKFTPNKTYSGDMQKEGIDLTADRDVMVFFLVNVKRSYVAMLHQKGYLDLDKDKLISLAALDVNEAYITSIKASFPDIDLDNLVPFRALNIDKAYIDEISNAGYKNLSPDKVITFKAQGIDGKYIADFRNSVKYESKDKSNENDDQDANINKKKDNRSDNKNEKNKNQDANRHRNKDKEDDDDDLIAFKAMNIDPAFINSFKEVGYTNLSNSDLISMKALGVTPDYVKSFRNAGYANVKPDDLVALKAQDVTSSLIKQYKDLGFDDLSLEDVIGAKATGTTPTFIKSMREKGHKMKSLEKYIALRSVLGD